MLQSTKQTVESKQVTILVAVYNTEQYLKECLDSLLCQTYKNLQIICIDDASTDSSPEILKEYADRDNRILLLRNEVNSGQSKTRNYGLKHATGEYITMVDSDDFLAPDAIERIMGTFCNHPETDCVLFDLQRFYSPSDIRPFINYTDRRTFSGEEALRLSINWGIHGLYVIRADIHKRIPYNESTRYTADDITTKLHYHACREIRLGDGTYFYRQHEQSISNAITIRRFDVFIADFALKKELEKLNCSTDILSKHEQLRWHSLVSHWRIFLDNIHHFTADERQEIEKSFDFHAATIDKTLIPAKLKLRTLFIPFTGATGMKLWAKWYLGLRKYVPSFLLKSRLKL